MGTLGMGYTLRSLKNSELFEIGEHDYYFSACRSYRGTTILVGNKKIFVDFWEYPTPTFTNETYNANFDLIIKLQWRNISFEQFLKESRKQNFLGNKSDEEIKSFYDKIVPWSFFPSRLMEPYIGQEQSLWSSEIKRDGFFCGKDWKCRRPGKKMVLSNNMEYIYSDQEKRNIIPDVKFIEMMRESKYGIVLPGRGSWATDTKNRREIDYMMLKKPILMTYEPHYYNTLIPGHHYIKWNGEKIEDIDKKFDLHFIAANGYKWYLENATPTGIASSFMKILNERFGNEIL